MKSKQNQSGKRCTHSKHKKFGHAAIAAKKSMKMAGKRKVSLVPARCKDCGTWRVVKKKTKTETAALLGLTRY